MSDQCKKYKEDYEKLLVLKQEFDAALEEGVKSRNLEEAKRIKIELEKAIIYLERDLKFKVWKTIELGTGLKTAEDFERALGEGGYIISNTARYLMEQSEFSVFPEKTKFELVIVSLADLGFPGGATLEEVYKRAREIGLKLCPPEAGPQLRLQYKDQPKQEWLRIAMETTKNFDIFRIGRDGGTLWLGAYGGSPGYVWDDAYPWVFVRRKL